MIKQLKKLFTPPEGRTIDMTRNGGWGRSLYFAENNIDVHGWLSPLPKKNDILLYKMQSGKVGKFRFTEVKPCGDPPDMFFGKVKGIGYAE